MLVLKIYRPIFQDKYSEIGILNTVTKIENLCQDTEQNIGDDTKESFIATRSIRNTKTKILFKKHTRRLWTRRSSGGETKKN